MVRYAITNGILEPSPDGSGPSQKHAFAALAGRARALAGQGVTLLLLRERRLGAAELGTLVQTVVAATKDTPLRVLVTERVDVALAAGASGVHFSSAPGELRASQVRRLMPRAFVSVSCHRLDEVRRARDDGASGILFAPVFGKMVAGREVVTGVGLDCLREACEQAGATPVFALGGVTEANAPDCLAAGAAGIAGIRLFFPEPAI